MEKLLTYLNALSSDEQEMFADRCGTSVGYIRKQICTGQNFGESLCISFEKESNRSVTCEELRPDLADKWEYIRGTEKSAA